MNAQSSKFLADSLMALTRHVVRLQARCDALNAMILALAQQAGADVATVRKQLKILEETALQKHLEHLEAAHPHEASLLDNRESLEDVDTELLKHLRFRS